jgi:putative tricarboxylic transport membrane protein
VDLATTDRKVQAAIGLGFIVAAVAMAGQTFLVDAEAGYAGIGPRFFPFAIAAGLGLCGLGLILEALTGGYRNLEGAPSGMKLDRAARQGLGWIVGGLAFQLLTIPYIGFVPTSAVLFTCVARAFGARSLWRSAAIGALMALTIWAIFTQLLGVSLQGFLRS